MKLLNVQEKVKYLLTRYPKTRNNDMLLYVKFAKLIDDEYQQDALHRPFEEVVLKLEEYHLPSFGSVGRVRRKLQEKYPELRADDKVEYFRSEEEQKYREYARS